MGKLARRLVALVLVGCGGAPVAPSVAPAPALPSTTASTPATGPAAIGDLPDAKSVAALAAKMDASCKDTCCLPKPEWTRIHGRESSAETTRAARAALEGATTPAEITLALRVLSHGATADDSTKLATLVDDTRTGLALPEEQVSQAWRECYPVSWKPASPSSEALRILGQVHGASFATARDYHAWAASHPDPEHSFEVWSARLSRQEPPPDTLVAKLRATDPALFLSLMLYRCRGDDRCGANVSELNTAVKLQAGVPRAMRWLDGSEPLPFVPNGGGPGESYANLLRGADVIFGTNERPALVSLWKNRRFARTADHALLALYLARAEPANRVVYLRDVVQHGAQELEPRGVALGLREASRAEPIALEREIASWFFSPPSRDQDIETAILEGLAASERRGAPVLGRLLQRPFPALSRNAALALHQAGTLFGCPNLGDPSAMMGYPSKGQSRGDQEQNLRAAEAQRAALATSMRACATKLTKTKP